VLLPSLIPYFRSNFTVILMFRSAILIFIYTLFLQAANLQGQISSAPLKGNTAVFDYIPQMPEFPGGEKELIKYIRKNLNYPSAEFYKGIHGRVIIRFVVDSSGGIQNDTVIKGIPEGKALETEARRVVKNMPKWKPGIQNGKAVAVYYNLPILFSLSSEIDVKETIAPSFPGGETAQKEFLADNLIYPGKARKKKIEGTAVIRVKIGADGSLLLPKPETLIGYRIEEEALRLVMLMPNWIPETHDGHPVDKEVRIRVVFKLPY
jgi:TonB family protein